MALTDSTRSAPAKADDALYATAEFVGYSLWLVPDATTERAIAGVIQELAERQQTPAFCPHMTLLGGIVGISAEDALEKTRKVAEMLSELDVEVTVVASKELLYFQCVFAMLKMTDALQRAHALAKDAFERREDPEFMPHISLVYGDLAAAQRKTLSLELGSRIDGMRMQMQRLQLWSTSGPVADWRLVGEFALPPLPSSSPSSARTQPSSPPTASDAAV